MCNSIWQKKKSHCFCVCLYVHLISSMHQTKKLDFFFSLYLPWLWWLKKLACNQNIGSYSPFSSEWITSAPIESSPTRWLKQSSSCVLRIVHTKKIWWLGKKKKKRCEKRILRVSTHLASLIDFDPPLSLIDALLSLLSIKQSYIWAVTTQVKKKKRDEEQKRNMFGRKKSKKEQWLHCFFFFFFWKVR